MYTVKHIADILNAETILINAEANIEQLLTDSRRLIFPETTLFFAIVTPRRDAHNFINELYERGVRNFVVLKHFDAAPFDNANFIFCDNTLAALQHVAAYHREQFFYTVMAITG